MEGSESRPQLISMRIFTFLSKAAVLMRSSITGQYLKPKASSYQREVEFYDTHLYLGLTCGGYQSVWWGSSP